VFGFFLASVTPVDDEDVTEAIESWLNFAFGYLKSITRNFQYSYDFKVDVVEWLNGRWETTRNVGTFVWTNPNNPENETDALPPGTAALVKLTTGHGKSYGRKFVAGLIEAVQDNGAWTGTALTALANFAGVLLSEGAIYEGSTIVPCLLSTKAGVVYTFIDAVVSSVVSYQRRRRQNVGS